MQLTDKLIEGLIRNYQSKGISVQKLLDNPEFKNLPLDKKVKVIENYKDQLTAVPTFNYKPVVVSGALGGLAGALAFGTSLMSKGHIAPTSSYVALGGLSATIAAIMAGLQERKQFNRDMATRSSIQNNRYLDAIINTSESRPKSVPPDFNQVTKPIEGMFSGVFLEHADQYTDPVAYNLRHQGQ